MNKPFIFILGIICGIFIYVFTNIITDSIKEFLIEYSTKPVTEQVESSKNPAQEAKTSVNETGQSTSESSMNYVNYWQSNGLKFKDVGDNGIEKTYVWNDSLNKWVDTGCIGNFEYNNSRPPAASN